MFRIEDNDIKLSPKEGNDLVEGASDISLNLVFGKNNLTDFSLHALSKYSAFADIALKNLLQF
jgi:hypothetical protein